MCWLLVVDICLVLFLTVFEGFFRMDFSKFGSKPGGVRDSSGDLVSSVASGVSGSDDGSESGVVFGSGLNFGKFFGSVEPDEVIVSGSVDSVVGSEVTVSGSVDSGSPDVVLDSFGDIDFSNGFVGDSVSLVDDFSVVTSDGGIDSGVDDSSLSVVDGVSGFGGALVDGVSGELGFGDSSSSGSGELFSGLDSELLNPFLDDDFGDEFSGDVGVPELNVHGYSPVVYDGSLRDSREWVTPGESGEGSHARGRDGFKREPWMLKANHPVSKSWKGESGHSRRSRARVRRTKPGSRVYRVGKYGSDSELRARGAVEFLVDEFGVLKPRRVRGDLVDADGFDKLVEAAEGHASVGLPDGFVSTGDSVVTDVFLKDSVVFPWARPRDVRVVTRGLDYMAASSRARVNERELEFYRGLGLSKTAGLDEVLRDKVARGAESWGVKAVAAAEKIVYSNSSGQDRFARNRGSLDITVKDFDFLCFLAKFRYATGRQLSGIHGVSERTAVDRLRGLAGRGLVEPIKVWGSANVWVATSAGLLLTGHRFPPVTAARISPALLSHSFIVNNTAANLWGGQVNVLNLPDFPGKFRRDGKGKMVFGETLVGETELQSGFSRKRLQLKAATFRPLIMNMVEEAFREWRDAGSPVHDSPEVRPGNEFMWMLMASASVGGAFHAPDLVVSRPRNPDGSPNSIAVEVELNIKEMAGYERVLRTYYEDRRLYGKVIWVVKNVGPASALERIAKEIGLWQEGRIDIVPILTRDGLFDGRDVWSI